MPHINNHPKDIFFGVHDSLNISILEIKDYESSWIITNYWDLAFIHNKIFVSLLLDKPYILIEKNILYPSKILWFKPVIIILSA